MLFVRDSSLLHEFYVYSDNRYEDYDTLLRYCQGQVETRVTGLIRTGTLINWAFS